MIIIIIIIISILFSFYLKNQNAASEQLKLLQANLALQNENIRNHVSAQDAKHVTCNGTSGETSSPELSKKNNNNGEVHFNIPYDPDSDTVL